MKLLFWMLMTFLAKRALKRHRPFIVAVTGSVGKTSAKEAVFALLNYRFPGKTRKTQGNLNTEQGVPLSILGLIPAFSVFSKISLLTKGLKEVFSADYPRYLILELGADKPGDIQHFTKFLRPDIAIITAIGEMPAHLEFYPEKDALIMEKEVLVKAVKPGGLVILNYDDVSVRTMREAVPDKVKIKYFGKQNAADMNIEAMNSSLNGVSFKLGYEGSIVPFRIANVLGWGHIYAFSAAALVGKYLEMNLVEISQALANYQPQQGRGSIIRGIKNSRIIDDSYNASPLAMENAIELVYNLKESSGALLEKIYVLGDMLELGVNTEAAHRMIGKKIAQFPSRILFLVGERVVFVEDEAIKNGYPKNNIVRGDKVEEILPRLQKELKEGEVVLIKGSHFLELDKAVEEIKFL